MMEMLGNTALMPVGSGQISTAGHEPVEEQDVRGHCSSLWGQRPWGAEMCFFRNKILMRTVPGTWCNFNMLLSK